jgi:hypothetical protein
MEQIELNLMSVFVSIRVDMFILYIFNIGFNVLHLIFCPCFLSRSFEIGFPCIVSLECGGTTICLQKFSFVIVSSALQVQYACMREIQGDSQQH